MATNAWSYENRSGSTSASQFNHSTILNVPIALQQLSRDTWTAHAKDIADSHSWLESFMETVQSATAAKGKGFVVFRISS